MNAYLPHGLTTAEKQYIGELPDATCWFEEKTGSHAKECSDCGLGSSTRWTHAQCENQGREWKCSDCGINQDGENENL